MYSCCFTFENHIGKLKNLVRKSEIPFQQLFNRSIEIWVTKNPSIIKLLCEHDHGPMMGGSFQKFALRNSG